MRRQFTCDPADMYSRDSDDHSKNIRFAATAKVCGFGDRLFWPNYIEAPWHLQMQVGQSLINFWPHKEKAHVQYEPRSKVANGFDEIIPLVFRVLFDCVDSEDGSVLEDE